LDDWVIILWYQNHHQYRLAAAAGLQYQLVLPTAAIRSDGALFTWGAGSIGRLGDGTTVNKSSPVQIGSSSWTSVSAGTTHTAAIRSDGALFTWALGTSGQLGDGTTVSKSSPVGFPLSQTIQNQNFPSPTQIGSATWSFASAGEDYSLVISTANALFVWGRGTAGNLGNGADIYNDVVVSPTQLNLTVNTTAAGYSHSGAILK
jgi:alpha-tubulin suppressor-like RCC1 family protein